MEGNQILFDNIKDKLKDKFICLIHDGATFQDIKVIVLLAFCEKYDSPFVIDVIFPDSDTNEETNDFLNNLIYNNNNNNNNNDDINDINENIFEISYFK